MTKEIRLDLRKGFSKAFGNSFAINVLEHAYKYKIDQDSNDNLIEGGELAQQYPDYNILNIHTHRSDDDAPAGTYINRKFLDPQNSRRWLLPYAYYFMDRYGFRNKFKKSLLSSIAIITASNFMDLDYYGVIQPYQVVDKDFPYTAEHAKNSYERFNLGLREKMKLGPTTVNIAPEGHRTDDGQMQRGETGVENIANRLRPCIINYMGFYCPGGSRSINLGKTMDIKVQKPQILTKDQRIEFFDIMSRLSLTLPENVRGVWRYSPMRVNIEDWSKQKSVEEIRQLCKSRSFSYFEITPESFSDNVGLRRVFPFGLKLEEPVHLLKISPNRQEDRQIFIEWLESNSLEPHFGRTGEGGEVDLTKVHLDLYGDKLRQFAESDMNLWRQQVVNFVNSAQLRPYLKSRRIESY